MSDQRTNPELNEEHDRRIRFWLSQYAEQLEDLLKKYPDARETDWHGNVGQAVGYLKSAVESIPIVRDGRCTCTVSTRGMSSFHCGRCGKVQRG